MDSLEIIFGDYKLQKQLPDITDSTSLASRSFFILFDNYVNIDSVINYLKTISDIDNPYYWHRDNKYMGPSDNSFKPGDIATDDIIRKDFAWFANGSAFEFHKKTCAWNLYSIKAPLAWEITQGKKEIIIDILDDFQQYTNDEYQNAVADGDAPGLEPGHGIGWGLYQDLTQYIESRTGDLYMRVYQNGSENPVYNTTQDTRDGNIIYNEYFDNDPNINNWLEDVGSGRATNIPLKLHQTHGAYVASVILPKLNNIGIVGVCPNCSAILNSAGLDPSGTDYNTYLSNNQTPNIAVQATQYGAPQMINAIRNGIICITFGEAPSYSSNFMTDIKTINAATMVDGEIMPLYMPSSNLSCVTWDPRIISKPADGYYSQYYKDMDEYANTYYDLYNNGIMNMKFNTYVPNSQPTIYRICKANGWPGIFDLVAPGQTLDIGKNRGYRLTGNTASFALAHIAGVLTNPK